MKATAQDTLAGVKAAISAGDIRLAVEILWAGIDVIWQRGVAGVKAKGMEWVDVSVQIAREVKAGMILGISGAWDSAVGLYQSGADIVATILDTLGVEVANKWDEIGQGVREAGAVFVAAWNYTRDKLKGEANGSLSDYMRRQLKETTDVTKTTRETRQTELTTRSREREAAATQRATQRAADQSRLENELGNQLADAASAQAEERRKRLAASNAAVTAAEKRLKDKVNEAKAAEAAAKKETDKKPPGVPGEEPGAKPGKETIGTTQAGIASRLFYGFGGAQQPVGQTNEDPVRSAGRANAEAADKLMETEAKLAQTNQALADNGQAWSAWSQTVAGATMAASLALPALSADVVQQINPAAFSQSFSQETTASMRTDNSAVVDQLGQVVAQLEAVKTEISALRQEGWS